MLYSKLCNYRRHRHSTISKEDELSEAKTMYETVFDVKGTEFYFKYCSEIEKKSHETITKSRICQGIMKRKLSLALTFQILQSNLS